MSKLIDRNYFKNIPTVLVVCEKYDLTLLLVNGLVNSGLFVAVVSKEHRELENIFSNNENGVFFRNIQDFTKDFIKLEYLIYIKNNSEFSLQNRTVKNQKTNDFAVFNSLIEKYKSKSLFVFYGVKKEADLRFYETELEKYFNGNKRYSGLVFYGDLGDSESEEHGTYLDYLLEMMVKNSEIKVNPGQYFFPISPKDLAVHLVELLFSLKAYGKKTAIFGSPIKANVLVKTLEGSKNTINIKENAPIFKFLAYEESIIIRRLSKKLIKEIYIRTNRKVITSKKFKSLKNIKEKICAFRKLKFKKRYPSKLKVFSFSLLLVLLTPFMLIFLSFGSLITSRIFLDKGFLGASQVGVNTAVFFAQKSYKYTFLTSQIPGVGVYFKFFLEPASLMLNESETAEAGLEIISSFSHLLESMFKKENLDIENFSQKLTIDLESLYQRLGFLESEFTEGGVANKLMSLPFRGLDLSLVRNKVYILKKVSEKIPLVLGKKNPTNYAVFFQNSHFLRPTGGRIETFSVINFSSGRILETHTEDVSFADRELFGQTEPPEILKKYFSQTNWYLRDSNWNPDFISSASTAAAFLDKEIDLSLDGIIFVDDRFISRMMTALRVGSDQKLDEILTAKDEEVSYPTEFKGYPLTNFLKKIVEKPVRLSKKVNFRVIRELFNGLENREVQVFVKDGETEDVLKELGWNGSFERQECGKRCFSDFASLIESTQNGDGRKISREVQFSVFFEEGIVKRKMVIFFENEGKDLYKAYLRVFANSEVGFSPISMKGFEDNKSINPELGSARGLKEAGTFLDLPAGESRAVIFNWEGIFPLKFSEKGEYRFSLRKQAGVDPYDTDIFVHLPEDEEIFSEPALSLTDAGVLRYNTSLTRDYNLRVFW